MKKTSQKTRVKAKNQQLVSRAVKEAGFKNIKEAKETLAQQKEQIFSNGEITPQFIIPEGENYKFIHQEISSLRQENAPESYIDERVKYLVWKTRKAEIEQTEKKSTCSCKGNCGTSETPAQLEVANYSFPVNTGYVFSSNNQLQESFAKELQGLFGPAFKVIGVQLR
jgi:hypothetical protein